jgi:hypothetical protein
MCSMAGGFLCRHRIPIAVAMVSVLLIGGRWVRAQLSEPHASGAATMGAAETEPPTPTLLRQGTQIVDQLGHFRTSGDRLIFFANDGRGRFVALENLNLERIALVLANNSGPLQWNVTGTITEFRGANYLLLERAILTTRTGHGQEGL